MTTTDIINNIQLLEHVSCLETDNNVLTIQNRLKGFAATINIEALIHLDMTISPYGEPAILLDFDKKQRLIVTDNDFAFTTIQNGYIQVESLPPIISITEMLAALQGFDSSKNQSNLDAVLAEFYMNYYSLESALTFGFDVSEQIDRLYELAKDLYFFDTLNLELFNTMKEEIYVAASLENTDYSKKVFEIFMPHGFKKIENDCNNVWCRDYMPVKNANGQFVQFIYDPSYLDKIKSWENKKPDAQKMKAIHEELQLKNVHFSKLKLDGGNVELHGKKAIISDRFFQDNECQSFQEEKEKLQILKTELAVDKVIVIPQYPYDFTGHVDGLIRFVDENTVLINDYKEEILWVENDNNSYRKKIMQQWHHSFKNILHNEGFKIETLSYTAGSKEEAAANSANGIYLNYLQTKDRIFVPTFKDSTKDKEARVKLQQLFPKHKVIQIEASALSEKGGVINCVSWAR